MRRYFEIVVTIAALAIAGCNSTAHPDAELESDDGSRPDEGDADADVVVPTDATPTDAEPESPSDAAASDSESEDGDSATPGDGDLDIGPDTDVGPPDPLTLILPGWSSGVTVNQASLPVRFLNLGAAGAEIRLDGNVVQTIAPLGCAGVATVDLLVDITGASDGEHTLSVRANDAEGTAHFTLDRTAPAKEPSIIDARARGQRIACFEPGTRAAEDLVNGEIVLGRMSDGLTPDLERLVIAAGRARVIYAPTSLSCTTDPATTYKHCTGTEATAPFAQSVELQQLLENRWSIRLAGGSIPDGTTLLGVRLGDDETLLSWPTLAPALDPVAAADAARRVSAIIGPAGGSLTTTDASGVQIRLDVPMDALTKPVEIAMVPLLSTLPTAPTAGYHPGVRFEPEGLQFALYATLTLQFPDSVTLPAGAVVALKTSPLTTLPLVGTRLLNGAPLGPATDLASRRVVVHLAHFSEMQGEDYQPSEVDYADWANHAIDQANNGSLPLWAIDALMDLEEQQQLLGACNDPTCPLALAVESAVRNSMQTVADAACTQGTAHPSIAQVDRIMHSEAIAQQVGVTLNGTFSCMDNILVALCNQAGTEAAASAPVPPATDEEDPALARMLDSSTELGTVYDYGQRLGFTDVTTTCTQQAVAACKQRVAALDASGTAAGGTAYDRERMNDLYNFGTTLADADLHAQAYNGLVDLTGACLNHSRAICADSTSAGLATLNELRTWLTTEAPLELSTNNPGLVNEIDIHIDQCSKPFVIYSADLTASCVFHSAADTTAYDQYIHTFPHTTTCGLHWDSNDMDVSATWEVASDSELKAKIAASGSWPETRYSGGSFGARGWVTLWVLKNGTLKITLDSGVVTLGTACWNPTPPQACSAGSICGCLTTSVSAGVGYQQQLCKPLQSAGSSSVCAASISNANEYTVSAAYDTLVVLDWSFGTTQPGTTADGYIASVSFVGP